MGENALPGSCCNADDYWMTYGIFRQSIPCVRGTVDTAEIHSFTWVSPNLETVTVTINECQHRHVHEIGEDFDEDGRLLRLIRCQGCGLLMREYFIEVSAAAVRRPKLET